MKQYKKIFKEESKFIQNLNSIIKNGKIDIISITLKNHSLVTQFKGPFIPELNNEEIDFRTKNKSSIINFKIYAIKRIDGSGSAINIQGSDMNLTLHY